jgi:hypothetical protein
MSAWTADDLNAIEGNADLFVSPFRDDGATYGTPTQTRALVVDGDIYVRAASGADSSWYKAAISQGAGRVRVADADYDVTFKRASEDVADAIDAAYEAKYPDSSAVPIMQSPSRARAIASRHTQHLGEDLVGRWSSRKAQTPRPRRWSAPGKAKARPARSASIARKGSRVHPRGRARRPR